MAIARASLHLLRVEPGAAMPARSKNREGGNGRTWLLSP